MGKFIKPGKCVVLTSGRLAGKKAVVVRNLDNGTKDRKYGYAVVAGVERAPRAVTKSMNKKVLARRLSIKPFVKIVNYNHMLPTRYGLEVDNIKELAKPETVTNAQQKKEALKTFGKLFKERMNSGKNTWFFSKLRF